MNIKKSTAFTLLEIVIAMLILSMVTAGIFGLFVTSSRYVVEAGHRLQAINYARQIAETLKIYRSASDTPLGATAAFANGTPTPTNIGLNSPRDIYTLSYTVNDVNSGNSPTGLKQVSITANWTES